MNQGASVWLGDVASAWSSWMLGMAWIVAVLVAILWLVTTILRARSASLLYALWLLVLVRLMLPPEFAFPTGWGWWVRTTRSDMVSDPEPVSPRAEIPAETPNDRIGLAEDTPSPGPDADSMPIAMIAMIAWLGIVAARCGMLFTAALQVHVWVARAHLVFDPALLELLEDCRNRVGVRRKVELRNSEACSTPLVVGIWRPVLLLPSPVLDRLDREQLRAVLIHELHHVRRWDGLVNLLQGLLGAAYFFHPAVWWANWRIRQLREDACDERTVAVLKGNRKPYGEAIFRVAEILGYSAPPLTLGVLDSTSPLTQRLRRILDPRLPIEGGLRWHSALILILATAILLPAGAKPALSVAESPTDRWIVAEAFSDGPLGCVKKDRSWRPREIIPFPDERTLPDSIRGESPPATADGTASEAALEELIGELAVAERRQTTIDALIAVGPVAEPQLLGKLAGAGPSVRGAIYDVLMRIGTERSLLPLHQALLMRGASEEDHIRKTLDAIYDRMEIPLSTLEPSMKSSRVYEVEEEEDEWGEPF